MDGKQGGGGRDRGFRIELCERTFDLSLIQYSCECSLPHLIAFDISRHL